LLFIFIFQLCFTEDIPGVVEHSIDNYQEFLIQWGCPAGKFPKDEYITSFSPDGFDMTFINSREVKEKEKYIPQIRNAEIIKIEREDKPDCLQLKLTGCNILNPVIKKCKLNFGFPFCRDEEKYQVLSF
jgi:hypothetical protein